MYYYFISSGGNLNNLHSCRKCKLISKYRQNNLICIFTFPPLYLISTLSFFYSLLVYTPLWLVLLTILTNFNLVCYPKEPAQGLFIIFDNFHFQIHYFCFYFFIGFFIFFIFLNFFLSCYVGCLIFLIFLNYLLTVILFHLYIKGFDMQSFNNFYFPDT